MISPEELVSLKVEMIYPDPETPGAKLVTGISAPGTDAIAQAYAKHPAIHQAVTLMLGVLNGIEPEDRRAGAGLESNDNKL